VTVWYYNPGAREDVPVVFVMQGAGSSARAYRDGWATPAAEKKFLLLVPEFCTPEDSDAARYNLGGMAGASGAMTDETCWTLTAIERIFDRAKAAAGITASRYSIYGHSAGAQFVHRLVLFKPAGRLHKAIAANAGWYTMPDFSLPFPYGLAGTGMTGEALRVSFSHKLVILLGENDTDPHHPGLRTTPEAMAQGANRLERGRRFFSSARTAAAEAAAPFNWEMQVVGGTGHESAAMSREALRMLLKD
jgi:poly(3-hydroxybutyrate) depolymerase